MTNLKGRTITEFKLDNGELRLKFSNETSDKSNTFYTEEEVSEILHTQRGNCYVAILSKTRNKELALIANNAPEPGMWRK